jgi:heme/copper-type cytochrome/quinol oxidase subunit 2
MTDAFIERYRLPDGTVYPRRMAAQAQPGLAGQQGHDAHAHGHDHAAAEAAADGPIDVLMVAGMWYYLPAALRLDAGEVYRFRMMAVDVSHGASIQLGQASRMARLRPGSVTEVELSIQQPGSYFMYCTVYCGQAHDFMQARIEVV